MKVSKPIQTKGHTKYQKWKDVRGKRCRPSISSSDLNSSLVMTQMIQEHQAAVRKKPNVKRLKKKAKSVSDPKKSIPQSGSKKSHTHTNGSSAFTMDIESDDSEDWKALAQSVHGNGVDPSDDMGAVRPGRLEGDSLHYCAERDDRRNHAVLVMQKDQVCKILQMDSKKVIFTFYTGAFVAVN